MNASPMDGTACDVRSPWTGRISYVTGGTYDSPRRIPYDFKRWERSISVKASIFRAHQVTRSSRVAVLLPFAPWSIGDVHVQAALHCGADVLPLGLSAGHSALTAMLRDFDPTHVCGGARNLVAWSASSDTRPSIFSRVAFVSGEPLSRTVRNQVAESWGARVINVYGMAEFDAVGAEFAGSHGIVLVPQFNYCALAQEPMEPRPGLVATLGVKSESDREWHDTGDRVRFVGQADVPGIGVNLWVVDDIERVEEHISFADGTAITSAQIESAMRLLGDVADWQLVSEYTNGRDTIVFSVVPERGAHLTPGLVRDSLLSANIDFADMVGHGVVSELRVVVTDNASASIVTSRSKRPRLLRVEEPK